jgi:hypothetical protein
MASDMASEDVRGKVAEMLAGKLTAVETEELLDTLSQSDELLDTADSLWAKTFASLQEAETDIPPLPPTQAEQLQQRLQNRLQRTHLSAHILQFGLYGFAHVAVALVRPFFRQAPSNDATNEK